MADLKEYSEKIKFELSIDQVKDFLLSLGADPIVHGNMIIARTICHGGHSHKMYYYDNTHLFRCYTECSEIFDIYELLLKSRKAEGIEISLPQAVNFIADFYGYPPNESFLEEQGQLQDWKILNKYRNNFINL